MGRLGGGKGTLGKEKNERLTGETGPGTVKDRQRKAVSTPSPKPKNALNPGERRLLLVKKKKKKTRREEKEPQSRES